MTSRELLDALEFVGWMMVLLPSMFAVVSGIMALQWWLVYDTHCDCRHELRRTARSWGPRTVRYGCEKCDVELTRVDDEWPPTCTRVDTGSPCGWPRCVRIRRVRDIPMRVVLLARRALWWFADSKETV